ncbi:CLUMA_CG007660, isoform A [Clunio marinus]|uniref:CLUMA_CG007660, isoform A n=1 Tax=Clunio marinus TaxID=568069 RepID=A0A1J1I1I3_9DIPT|nr:CLUMA_CG007660, isoform A [Clunio marinus]
MEKNHQYESIQALVRQLHAPDKNVSRPRTDEEVPNDDHSLPILVVEKPHKKKTYFENTFKIPTLMVTAPTSPESPENMENRKFSFGNFRRHSHGSKQKHAFDKYDE